MVWFQVIIWITLLYGILLFIVAVLVATVSAHYWLLVLCTGCAVLGAERRGKWTLWVWYGVV